MARNFTVKLEAQGSAGSLAGGVLVKGTRIWSGFCPSIMFPSSSFLKPPHPHSMVPGSTTHSASSRIWCLSSSRPYSHGLTSPIVAGWWNLAKDA